MDTIQGTSGAVSGFIYNYVMYVRYIYAKYVFLETSVFSEMLYIHYVKTYENIEKIKMWFLYKIKV